jgi:sec-independent protein translocase protein TatC
MLQTPNNHSATLTIWEHIVALKRVVLLCLGTLLVAASLVHWQRESIIGFLLVPLGETSQPLQFLSPLDPLYFILKVDFTLGFLLALPFILGFIWRFVSPALNVRWWVPVIVVSVASVLSFWAALYAYFFVTPIILSFMSTIIIPGTTAAFTAAGYLDFLLSTTLILVFVFQIPLLLVGAIGAGLISHTQITNNRPYVYLGAVSLSAIVTPTTDVLTLGLVAGPAIAAVELGVGTARILFRGKTL